MTMFALLSLLAAMTPAVAPADPPRQPDSVAARRADLAVLARELPARHPNAFTVISRPQWDSAVAALDRRLPGLRRTQWIVELQRLVALIGDAHTAMNPGFDPALGFRYYPFEPYAFDDGLVIVRAAPEHADLVGARIVRIGRAPVDEAVRLAGTALSSENEWWIRAWAPFYLMIPEMLDGLGIADDMERLRLVVERHGRVDTVVVRPAGPLHATGHGGGLPIDQSGWTDLGAQAAAPLWRRHPDRVFWFEYLPEARTVYVAYRAVAFTAGPHGPLNQDFWDQVFASVDERQAERLVIDVRENTGGNGFLNRHVIQQVLRRPRIDRPDALFVIIGRRTFSAAQQLVNHFDWWTQATFVGEPTGQRTSQFGDHEPLVLPNSGLTVQISTVFHQAPNVFDRRAFVAPDVYTPLASGDLRAGRDPAWQAVGTLDQREPLDRSIETAVARGDTGAARRILDSAVAHVANRYRGIEQEVNALGYRLLNEGRAEDAIAVFRLNTARFRESANVWDSLGEALEQSGRRDEAIASYREALARDPDYPSSVRALQRLGADRR
jgi:hypothetical protein